MAEEAHPLALSLPANAKEASPGATATATATAEAERARRRHMSRLYAELGAMLPGLPPRANMARILEEAIAYVGLLRATVAGLEADAALTCFAGAAAARTAAPAEVLVVPGKASCFALRLPAARRPGALTRVLEVFRRHGVPVLAATMASDGGDAAVTVTTTAVAPAVLERIQADISKQLRRDDDLIV